jgi:16S rRNA (uracil1498-N3)-methyltransferase
MTDIKTKAGGRVLIANLPGAGKPRRLSEEEAHHLVHVLRRGDADELEAMDGRGGSAICRISLREGGCYLEWVREAERQVRDPDSPRICVALGVLKGDAMEWVVEKCVELGVNELQPLDCDHCVVKFDKKGPEIFRDRWKRIADQALKQSGRRTSMGVGLPARTQSWLDQKVKQPGTEVILLDEATREESLGLLGVLSHLGEDVREVVLLVGPEGGWSQKERLLFERSKLKRATLGRDHILRAETAALLAASVACAVRGLS